ncbi:MAG: pantoate kinase [Methanocellales archaeon]
MLIGRAFAPAHITGFFEICEDSDPRKMGSRGCGFTLDVGVTTEVKIGIETFIELNGAREKAETSRWVVNALASDVQVEVRSKVEVPIGCGLGASGAGALSTAFALNQALDLGKSFNELALIAHIAEVENRTGLGSVTGQCYGGVVIRKQPGGVGFGEVDRIPMRGIDVFYIAMGAIPTKEVITSSIAKKKINTSGREALKALLKKPTFENFMALSKKFSYEIELLSSRARDIIEAVEASGGKASMAMIGDTVFAVDVEEELLRRFGEVKKSKIGFQGVHLI